MARVDDRRPARPRRRPVLVGGSALYTRAVLDRFEFPGTDEASTTSGSRTSWQPTGPAALHERLRASATPRRPRASSPRTAAGSSGRSRWSRSPGSRSAPSLPQREYVDCRTPTRSGSSSTGRRSTSGSRSGSSGMFAGGFVDEVDGLVARGLAEGRDRVPGDRLPRGDGAPGRRADREEAREATKAATRRFARRQDSWFRKDDRITWVEATTTPAWTERSPRSRGS